MLVLMLLCTRHNSTPRRPSVGLGCQTISIMLAKAVIVRTML